MPVHPWQRHRDGVGMGVGKGSGKSSSEMGKLDFQEAWLRKEESGEKIGGKASRGSHSTESHKNEQEQPRQLWALYAAQLWGSHQNQHFPASHPLPHKV